MVGIPCLKEVRSNGTMGQRPATAAEHNDPADQKEHESNRYIFLL